MAVAYSQDMRDRVLAAYERGMTTRQIADLFSVSTAWARRVRQRHRETGQTSALPRGGATVIKIDMARLAELVKLQPDATLRELRDRLDVECSEAAICIALKRLGYTFKKRRSMQPSKSGRMSPSAETTGSRRSTNATPVA